MTAMPMPKPIFDNIPPDEWPNAVLRVLKTLGLKNNSVRAVRNSSRLGSYIVDPNQSDEVLVSSELRKAELMGLDAVMVKMKALMVKE